MKKKNKVLQLFVTNFINHHFEDIDWSKFARYPDEKIDWGNKKQAITNIKKEHTLIAWFITEVMKYGLSFDYLEGFKVQNDEGKLIIEIYGKYFALDYLAGEYFFVEVFPKRVIVEKLIFETSQN